VASAVPMRMAVVATIMIVIMIMFVRITGEWHLTASDPAPLRPYAVNDGAFAKGGFS
jgi:hypothetical protein